MSHSLAWSRFFMAQSWHDEISGHAVDVWKLRRSKWEGQNEEEPWFHGSYTLREGQNHQSLKSPGRRHLD
jgi:hypothetical protein